YRSSRKARESAEAFSTAAAHAVLSAEGMRAALSSPAGAPALLQRALPGGARKWSRWKAQQRYRETAAGQQKRNGQSRRYRERAKSRKTPEPEAVDDPARVITSEHFFRPLLRPTRLLRGIRGHAAKSLAALLFAGMPARVGTRPRAGTTLETGAHLV